MGYLTLEFTDIIIQTGILLGILMGFTEWRYRALHSCLNRIESRLDSHLDKGD